MTTRGIDVSAYQPNARMKEAKAAGAEFAIVKVTDGNGYANPHAAKQVDDAIAAGLLVMLYHYARPNGPDWEADARAEAKRLDDIADTFEAKYGKKFFCWLDVERNEPLTDAEKPWWRKWCNIFRQTCRALGRAIGWYSYKPFTEALSLDATWTSTLLWLARYPIPFVRSGIYFDKNGNQTWAAGHDALGQPTDKCPLPWGRADVWQDGGDANGATWPGIDGPCDCNVFAGTLDELRELIEVAA